jgi:hypothetical protein
MKTTKRFFGNLIERNETSDPSWGGDLSELILILIHPVLREVPFNREPEATGEGDLIIGIHDIAIAEVLTVHAQTSGDEVAGTIGTHGLEEHRLATGDFRDLASEGVIGVLASRERHHDPIIQ